MKMTILIYCCGDRRGLTVYLRFLLTGVQFATANTRQKQHNGTVDHVNMSELVFSSQEDELFIESVLKYLMFYEISHTQYKNLIVKDSI